MDRAGNHRKIIAALPYAVLLFFAQLKPLHHLILQHSVVENKDLCGIHQTQRHCAVCDYHFSYAIAPAPPVVQVICQPYVLLKAAGFSYDVVTVAFYNYKRGPPFPNLS